MNDPCSHEQIAAFFVFGESRALNFTILRDIRTAASWERDGSNDVNNNPSYCLDNGQISAENPTKWCAPGEVGCTPPDPLSQNNHEARGANWANFRYQCTTMFTILPPNTENCVGVWIDSPGTMSASSNHQGGAHVLMSDGAVIFMTDSVEAGDSRAGAVRRYGNNPPPTPSRAIGSQSPYGLWGALGTKASSEVIEEQLNQ